MAYQLDLHRERVLGYFRSLEEVPREVRIRVFLHLHENLGEHGDVYREDAGRRLAPGSEFFWYDIVLVHEGRGYLFRFAVSDAMAAYGFLRVDYVDRGPDRTFPNPAGGGTTS